MPRSARSSADAISARLRDLELLTKGPAWALTRSAPWVIAVLQASFTRTRPQLPLEEFHADVDSFLEQLRREDPSLWTSANGTPSGKKYADEWTRKQFLTRRNQSGRIVYEVTEPAARVLAFLDSLSSERSTLNGSRLGTLLGDVEKLANETNPDQSARLESLEEEIEQRQQLIEDISSGEFDGLLDDDQAVEAAGNVLDLAASLPADYKKMRDRIEELVGELRNQIIEESLSKGATMAQVLEADKRLRQSPEGRTFRSFTAFLEDPQQQLRFRSAIGEVLSRQFADELTAEERETLKNLVAELRQQHSQIQRIYGKLSESLNTYVQSDDFRQSVRLRKVLGEAEQAIRSLPYERDRPGLVPGPLLFNAGFESLAMVKLFDPDEFAVPPRLAEPIAFSDSDRVRSPRTAKAKPDVVRAALAGAGTLAEAWDSLPAEERHINSIRALLSEALHEGAGFDRDAWSAIEFAQIDGSTRQAYLPVVTLKKD
ncbi:DUF3375 family protein [Pseudarthrobacter sp. J75]|uniref:DUF3375 family protein n=1 Tax=unclassified Pseudarthrobacter TaxID=2647000 RepID=UPI002E81D1E2|nr:MULTISPECIES: DUF3375 family protein [unclassified Pseudarthrobacter]MEE2524614.1 DUF3375 family protein [Pseudarthrobacter sp. J47]MEE2530708.1 DUF3375 family protein [Pseudarthrobacter sp. J75]